MRRISRQPRCCLLSLSTIADDPRVRRHGDALATAGWDVVAVGLPGGRGTPPAWPVRTVAVPPPGTGVLERGKRIARVFLTGRSGTALPLFYKAFPAYHQFLAAAENIEADLYIANDWPVLPVAAALAQRHGGRLIYDSHELATAEREESWIWRLLYGRLARAIETRFIHDAHTVMTVSSGIAAIMADSYHLRSLPVVVRNTPLYVPVPARETDPTRLTVLFQGLLAPGRGLETLIDSVPLWRPEFHLTLRGPINQTYRSEIEARISALNAQERITLCPPCVPQEMILKANLADIGIHPMEPVNRNNSLALPNKLFEYIMAGLAVCASNLPEMAALIQNHGCGRIISGQSPNDFAEAINGFSEANIRAFKLRSAAASKELCWDKEQNIFVEACNNALS